MEYQNSEGEVLYIKNLDTEVITTFDGGDNTFVIHTRYIQNDNYKIYDLENDDVIDSKANLVTYSNQELILFNPTQGGKGMLKNSKVSIITDYEVDFLDVQGSLVLGDKLYLITDTMNKFRIQHHEHYGKFSIICYDSKVLNSSKKIYTTKNEIRDLCINTINQQLIFVEILDSETASLNFMSLTGDVLQSIKFKSSGSLPANGSLFILS